MQIQLSMQNETSQSTKFFQILIVGFVCMAIFYGGRVQAGNLLWVGARPGDEIYAAPLLGKTCNQPSNNCSMLVMTEQETEDTHENSTDQMSQAAEFFKSHLTHWNLARSSAQHVEGVLSKWALQMGGLNNLLEDVQIELLLRRPDAVLIFDPRHGSSCDIDRRASATLVLHAARLIEFPFEKIYMVESTSDRGLTDQGKLWNGYRKVASDDKMFSFDGGLFWGSLMETMRIHSSRFRTELISSIGLAPSEARKVHFLRASDAVDSDVRFSICPTGLPSNSAE